MMNKQFPKKKLDFRDEQALEAHGTAKHNVRSRAVQDFRRNPGERGRQLSARQKAG